MTNIDEMSINAIRVLSADAIQKANSGHPGLPLGTAPTAYELWTNHMNYNRMGEQRQIRSFWRTWFNASLFIVPFTWNWQSFFR